MGKLGRLALEEEAGGRLGHWEADAGGQGVAEFQGSRERPWTWRKGYVQAPLGGSGRGGAGLPGEQRKQGNMIERGQSVECRQEVQTEKRGEKTRGHEHRANAEGESTC